MGKGFFACLVLALCASALAAQESFLSIEWENDGSTWDKSQSDNDKWYTNGIRLKYGIPSFLPRNTRQELEKENEGKPEAERIPLFMVPDYDYVNLGGNLRFRSEPGADAYGLTDSIFAHFADSAFWTVFEVAQNMYTPMDITLKEAQYSDRPYAGWSRFGWSLYRQKTNRLQKIGIDLGMLGEAGAGVTQTMVHYLVGAQHPEGWSTHVKDRFAFQLRFADQVDYIPDCVRLPGRGEYAWFSITNSYEVQLGNVLMSALYKPLLRFGIFKESNIFSPTPSIPSIPKMIAAPRPREESEKEPQTPGESPGAAEAAAPKPGKRPDLPVEFFVFVSPGVSAVTYDGSLDHQADPNYRISLVPLRLCVEAGAELDLVNTWFPACPLKRFFIRYSPFYYCSPDFAVDNNWYKVEGDVIPDNINILGRWYVGGGW